jgi:Sucrose synthase
VGPVWHVEYGIWFLFGIIHPDITETNGMQSVLLGMQKKGIGCLLGSHAQGRKSSGGTVCTMCALQDACGPVVLGLPQNAAERPLVWPQGVYILDQVRALEGEMRAAIEAAGLNIVPRILVVTRRGSQCPISRSVLVFMSNRTRHASQARPSL